MKDFDFSMIDNSEMVLKAKDEAVEAALEAIGQQAASHARRNITAAGRVDTGNLRNSMTHQVKADEEAVYIGSNVPYAPYVEFGTGEFADEGGRKGGWWYKDDKGKWHFTRGMKPTHFLRDAVQDHTSEYKNIAQAHLKNA